MGDRSRSEKLAGDGDEDAVRELDRVRHRRGENSLLVYKGRTGHRVLESLIHAFRMLHGKSRKGPPLPPREWVQGTVSWLRSRKGKRGTKR